MRRRNRFSRRPSRGFTLIEVLLVLVILVVLVGLVVGTYTGAQTRALMDAAQVQVRALSGQVEEYHIDMKTYPTTSQGLEALIYPPSDLPNPARWRGPYARTQEIPLDPWDRPYQYESPGRFNPYSFDIWSMGPDGVSGTEDDIGNW